jgi:signal transduction histidine kinase
MIISNKSEIHVEIIDFGIGIPEEDQPKLFNTLEQVIRKELREQVWASIVKTFMKKTGIIG